MPSTGYRICDIGWGLDMGYRVIEYRGWGMESGHGIYYGFWGMAYGVRGMGYRLYVMGYRV